jgi:hypothetical protein
MTSLSTGRQPAGASENVVRLTVFIVQRGHSMSAETKIGKQSGVDKGLVAMFLKMSPEERLLANDNAFRTILELRDAYRQQKAKEREPE